MTRRWIGALCVASLTSLLLQGCSDDEPATTGAASSSAASSGSGGSGGEATGTTGVTGTVEYAGTQQGPALYVAAFTEWPAMGPPAGFTRVGRPTFPAEYTMSVPPGEWALISYLSVGSDHFMGPSGPDPLSVPVTITVTDGQTTTQDLTLEDPSAGGAGGTGGAAGGAGGVGGASIGGAGGAGGV